VITHADPVLFRGIHFTYSTACFGESSDMEYDFANLSLTALHFDKHESTLNGEDFEWLFFFI
jgi:hypothetical protein